LFVRNSQVQGVRKKQSAVYFSKWAFVYWAERRNCGFLSNSVRSRKFKL